MVGYFFVVVIQLFVVDCYFQVVCVEVFVQVLEDFVYFGVVLFYWQFEVDYCFVVKFFVDLGFD